MNIKKIGRAENLTGNVYGRLTAVSYESSKWTCKCECGSEIKARAGSLKSGNTKSCGCLQKEKASTALINYFKDYREGKGSTENLSTDDQIQRQHFIKLRPSIMKRDDYTCPLCSTRGCKLQVHHIETWKSSPDKRLDTKNLVTLCVPCHKMAHENNFKTGLDEHLAIILQGYVNEMEDAA